LKAKHCVLSIDLDGILHSLNDIADNLKLLKSILARMHGKNLKLCVAEKTLRKIISVSCDQIV